MSKLAQTGYFEVSDKRVILEFPFQRQPSPFLRERPPLYGHLWMKIEHPLVELNS